VHVGRPPSLLPGCTAEALFHETFICITPQGPRGTQRMSMREYSEAQHVRVRVLDNARDPIDIALAARGIERKVSLTVPHFSLAPLVVLRSGYVATLSARLAHVYAGFLPLSLRAPPVTLSPRPVQMIWHQRTDTDPGAHFFRQLLIDASH
jgi:DNA-binding transcriptional LysR family regulator